MHTAYFVLKPEGSAVVIKSLGVVGNKYQNWSSLANASVADVVAALKLREII